MACQTAFVSLKTAFTSAPVLWHFDSALRTAVHIDGSRNAVGADIDGSQNAVGAVPSMGNQTVCALKGTPPSKDVPRVSTLLHDIRAAVPDDAFLGDVLQAALDSDDNFYREFFVDDNQLLCFRRSEDVVPRVCVPAQCKGAALRAAHGDSLLAGHPGIDRTMASIAHDVKTVY